ncbi:ankyrin repeat-containing protein [Cavenderia fasciculata]|uniref:Ankyrin repeat-containing protein n=1 Tax=Cavenderia fasciculata TaxID=261658 RepID=F4PL62_CACFS|nr:ankyrin repeat-containing protein [Cavenderia fasciculata]EGG23284.1 ankyrin repeat-containing protein [Cavenderia fasciculata]|eukprot:XP_004361135.1 ankyrin repeat-containing protein [Cavenderia fasciculata]
MDSFNKFLFETYKEFNTYIKALIISEKKKPNSTLVFYSKPQDSTTTSNNGDEQQQITNETSTSSSSSTTTSTSITIPKQTLKIDFLSIGRDLVARCKDTESYEEEEVNQFLEFIMCLCFFSGNPSVWRPLIEENVRLFSNQKTVNKNFGNGIPFSFAIPFGAQDLLELLVSKGMDSSLTQDNSYIMTTALYGNLEAFDFFIKRGASLNHKNSNGDTAILFASMNGENELIEKLVKHGESLLAVNNHGFNVIVCAAFHNQFETIQLLGETIEKTHGTKKLQEMLDHKNKDGETALHIASRLGFYSTVQLLTKLGATINLGNKMNQTPLELATRTMGLLKRDSNLISSYDPQRKKMEEYCKELDTLVYIQPLLAKDFKVKLFSKPNLVSTVRETARSYQKVIQIFETITKQKELENENNLKSLLLGSVNNNNSKNTKKTSKSKPKPKQPITSKSKPSPSPPINPSPPIKINQPSNNNKTSPPSLSLDVNINNSPNQEMEKAIEKEMEKENNTKDNNNIKLDNENSISINQPKIMTPQQQQQQQQEQEQKEVKEEEIDYKKKYETLATLYLEQNKILKETLTRLDDIERNFSRFNKSLYKKNEKAEALGLGISEILGLGLRFLSMEQLTVLSDIHMDSINKIQLIQLISGSMLSPGMEFNQLQIPDDYDLRDEESFEEDDE